MEGRRLGQSVAKNISVECVEKQMACQCSATGTLGSLDGQRPRIKESELNTRNGKADGNQLRQLGRASERVQA